VLAQPAESLTDLLLGVVVTLLVVRLRRRADVNRHWVASFGWAAVAALCGAVHHAVMVRWAWWGELSWSLITVMIVVAVSYLLAGTVLEVLGSGHAREFWVLRSLGLLAYLALAVTGHAGVGSMLACEGLTMASVVALWVLALYRHHPLARPVLFAILVSGLAGVLQALSPSVTGLVGLDPTSAYHLGQIVGMVALFRALTRGRPEPADASEPEPAAQTG
jgi:hypothetical protein